MTDYPLLNAIIFAGLGIVIFVLSFMARQAHAVSSLTEIVKEKRRSGDTARAMSIGMCIIIAAAVH
jgi:uncharacterized membrane protein YjfL (UPF0719 family)